MKTHDYYPLTTVRLAKCRKLNLGEMPVVPLSLLNESPLSLACYIAHRSLERLSWLPISSFANKRMRRETR